MHRTNSETSSTAPHPKGWRFGSALKRIGSRTFANQDKTAQHRKHSFVHDYDPHDAVHSRHLEHASIHESSESSSRELQQLVQRMRSAPTGPNNVDAAYKEFTKIFERAAVLCSNILYEEIKPPSPRTITDSSLTQRDPSMESPRSQATAFDSRSSFSGKSLGEVITNSGTGRSGVYGNDVWLAPIRDWKMCVEALIDAFRTNLADTYMNYCPGATQDKLDTLFSNKKFRREAVNLMHNASLNKVYSLTPDYLPRYEIRFRDYDKARLELINIRQLLQSGESGIAPSRTVVEFDISPHGDAVLEFVNLLPEASPDDPVFRFRVSGPLLAETSPIFARLFAGRSSSMLVHDAEDISTQLPPPPSKYYCKDGTEAWLYRMPQHEVNRHNAMETLLYAAHMRNDMIPREISFEQFVAIAECSIRYKSTSPLEVMVEHLWLPKWVHKGADEMPDGLLIISYAFGSRGLFTRMSKTAILNLKDENDLQSKPWPQKIKDKLWAVRSAKIAQLYDCCTSLLREYLQAPTAEMRIEPDISQPHGSSRTGLGSGNATTNPTTDLTSTPRCPKGSHWCDASMLGWLMLVFNNMNVLSPMLQSPTIAPHPANLFPAKSLAQIIDLLRSVPSPATPVHRSAVCDPIPSFRTAIGDIFNTVTGLTLHDVSGRSHGWALSKNVSSEPQTEEAKGLDRMAAHNDQYTVATEFPEDVLLRVLSEVDDLEDLHAIARVNRAFYETYKLYELPLIRNILRVGRVRGGSVHAQKLPIISTNAENKSLASTVPSFRDRGQDDRNDQDDDDDDDDSDASSSSDERSDDEMPEPSADHDPNNDQRPPEYEALNTPIARRPSAARIDSDRSSSVASSSHSQSQAAPDAPMTEEEARRILYGDDEPDAPPKRTLSSVTVVPPPASGVGLREKFLMDDPLFAQGFENKTLITVEQNELRLEHARRQAEAKDSDEQSDA